MFANFALKWRVMRCHYLAPCFLAARPLCTVDSDYVEIGGPNGQPSLPTPTPVVKAHTHYISLQWRRSGRDDVSLRSPTSPLLNRLFRRRSKKASKLCVTGLCAGNSPVTGEFPAQMTSNAENASIWWRHHGWWWRMDANGTLVQWHYAFCTKIATYLHITTHSTISRITCSDIFIPI